MEVSGTGINLHKDCCRGLMMQLPNQVAKKVQGKGRLHRLGQKDEVSWYVLMPAHGIAAWDEKKMWVKFLPELASMVELPALVTGKLRDIILWELIRVQNAHSFNRYAWVIRPPASSAEWFDPVYEKLGNFLSMIATILLNTLAANSGNEAILKEQLKVFEKWVGKAGRDGEILAQSADLETLLKTATDWWNEKMKDRTEKAAKTRTRKASRNLSSDYVTISDDESGSQSGSESGSESGTEKAGRILSSEFVTKSDDESSNESGNESGGESGGESGHTGEDHGHRPTKRRRLASRVQPDVPRWSTKEAYMHAITAVEGAMADPENHISVASGMLGIEEGDLVVPGVMKRLLEQMEEIVANWTVNKGLA
jgi:hypothetical protein